MHLGIKPTPGERVATKAYTIGHSLAIGQMAKNETLNYESSKKGEEERECMAWLLGAAFGSRVKVVLFFKSQGKCISSQEKKQITPCSSLFSSVPSGKGK